MLTKEEIQTRINDTLNTYVEYGYISSQDREDILFGIERRGLTNYLASTNISGPNRTMLNKCREVISRSLLETITLRFDK